jgi:hypothetical protein
MRSFLASPVAQVLSRLAALGLLALGAGACDSLGPEGPSGSGSFLATLVSPHGNEASAVFELTGGVGLGTVSPIDGEVFYQHFGASTRIVVVMDDPGEVRFQVRTEDIGQVPEVTVIQVASGENELRASLSGYSVQIAGEKDSSLQGQGE